MDTNFKVLCADCQIDVDVDARGDGVVCPRCGRLGTRDEVQSDVQAHHHETAAVALQRKAKGISEEHPWFSYQGGATRPAAIVS